MSNGPGWGTPENRPDPWATSQPSSTPMVGEPDDADWAAVIPRRRAPLKAIVGVLVVIGMLVGASSLIIFVLNRSVIAEKTEQPASPNAEVQAPVTFPDAGANIEACAAEQKIFELAKQAAQLLGDSPRDHLLDPEGRFFRVNNAEQIEAIGSLPPGCSVP